MMLRMVKSLEGWFKKYLSTKRIIIAVILLTIFYNEFIVYWIQSSNWPTIPKVERDKELVVLLVADPQIGLQGEDEDVGFPLDTLARWDADRYLYKTFDLAYSYCSPDVVIFLGDLMDGGSQADHDEYERYFQRFSSIFSSAKQSKVIYIPGDNDIGGEGRDFRTRLKEARYESYFENVNGVVKTDLVDFLKLDVQFHSNIPPGTDKLLKEFRSKMTSSFRVILTHETMLPKMKEYIYPILKEIQPQLIISGHWHKAMHYLCDSCINDNSDSGHWPVHVRYLTHIRDYIYLDLSNSQGIQEIMVPTCSYRMTDADIGYGVAIMSEDNNVKYTVLWLPLRYTYLKSYIIIFISLIIFYIITKTCLPLLIPILYRLIRPSSKKI